MSRKSKTMQFRLKSGNKPSPTKFYGAMMAGLGGLSPNNRQLMNSQAAQASRGMLGMAAGAMGRPNVGQAMGMPIGRPNPYAGAGMMGSFAGRPSARVKRRGRGRRGVRRGGSLFGMGRFAGRMA